MNSAAILKTQEEEQYTDEYSATMRKHLREHIEGTNVNASSLLTTDYLNHFSSMVMLLEQLPETPEELIIYLLAWEPIGYIEHFEKSGFRDAHLAQIAYHHAPQEIRNAFDQVIEQLHNKSIQALNIIREQAESGNTEGLTRTCVQNAPALRELIDEASRIVNQNNSAQTDVDQQFDD